MKKILSLVLVIVMMMSMTVTAFAAGEQSGTSTVTAVVPEPVPEYTIHIPADMTLEYGNGERQLVGQVYVSDVKNIPASTSIAAFMKITDLASGVNVIPTSLEWRYEGKDEYKANSSPFVFNNLGEYNVVNLYLTVTKADWQVAKPGTYAATITYSFKLYKP